MFAGGPTYLRVILLLVAVFLAGPGLTAGTMEEKPLLFGVLNQQSPIQTAEKWNPILRYLSQVTDIPLHLKMGPTVQHTDAMMGQEVFDLVYTNHNFQPKHDGRYKVLARWAGEPIHGVIVVRDDSPAKNLQDLQGLTVAFPSTEAFVAYAVPSRALQAAEVTVTPRFAGNQDGALAQLKARQVDAAAVNSRFMGAYARRENLRLRKLFISEPYHELPVLIHPRVPAEQAQALQHALLGMRDDPAAETILRRARSQGFVAADEHDYDNVRAIYRSLSP